MAEAGILGSVLGGVPLLASLSNLVKLEAALGLTPDAVRRLGALGVQVLEDAERLWQRLRLFNAEHARLASMGDGWWRITSALGEQGARALLYRLGPVQFTDRVLLAWARSEEGAAAAHGMIWRPCRSAGPRRPSRSGPRIHRARRRQGSATRRGAARRRSGVDRRRLSGRDARVGRHRRCGHPSRAVGMTISMNLPSEVETLPIPDLFMPSDRPVRGAGGRLASAWHCP